MAVYSVYKYLSFQVEAIIVSAARNIAYLWLLVNVCRHFQNILITLLLLCVCLRVCVLACVCMCLCARTCVEVRS